MARLKRSEVLDPESVETVRVYNRVVRRCFWFSDDVVTVRRGHSTLLGGFHLLQQGAVSPASFHPNIAAAVDQNAIASLLSSRCDWGD